MNEMFFQLDISLALYALQAISVFGLLNAAIVLGDL